MKWEEERSKLKDYQRDQSRWKTRNSLILCHQKAVARPHYCQRCRRHRRRIIIKLKFTWKPSYSVDDDDGWTSDKTVVAVDKWLSSLMAIWKKNEEEEAEGIRTSRGNGDVRKERRREKERERRRRRRRRKTKSYLLTLGSREKDVSSLPDYFPSCSFFLSLVSILLT